HTGRTRPGRPGPGQPPESARSEDRTPPGRPASEVRVRASAPRTDRDDDGDAGSPRGLVHLVRYRDPAEPGVDGLPRVRSGRTARVGAGRARTRPQRGAAQ